MPTHLSSSSLDLQEERRTVTTIVAFLVIGFAILGIFLAGIQLIWTILFDPAQLPNSQPTKWKLYVAAIVGILPKLVLLLVGIFMLLRERLALSCLGLAFLFSLLNAAWQWFVALPAQLQFALTNSERLGFYLGIYAVYFAVIAFYLAVFFFLNNPMTRREFKKRVIV